MAQTARHPSLRLTALAAGLAIAGGLVAAPAHAQTAPDAGQTLQPLRRVPEPQRRGPVPEAEAPRIEAVLPGGAKVMLRGVRFSSNTVFDAATLDQALAGALSEPLDLAGMRGLAERVSAVYLQAGYPFARAYLPPQDLRDGVLRIEVLEGRFGRVAALIDDPAWATQAQAFLEPLQPGAMIEAHALERATLLLGDQPGVSVTPVLKPGAQVGTGDLELQVERLPAFSGSVGLDNQGNRYSGSNRALFNLDWSSPFRLGDQISLRTMVSNQKLWLGSLGYSVPLGAQGLRLNLSQAHTHYELGGIFAGADASGWADVSSAGLSYALLRTNVSNLKLSAALQGKRLRDDKAGASDRKSSRSLPLTLDFDHRDAFAGGGISYGSVALTAGHLDLADGAPDLNNTQGGFTKTNLDLLRLQNLPGTATLYGRFSAQWSNRNLDSSERISLGGAGGIRAYPSGEAVADAGWLLQLELRQPMADFAPYVFVDTGHIRIDHTPVVPGGVNQRALGGAGVGLRYARAGWNLDAALARRTQGGPPQADPSSKALRTWVSASLAF